MHEKIKVGIVILVAILLVFTFIALNPSTPPTYDENCYGADRFEELDINELQDWLAKIDVRNMRRYGGLVEDDLASVEEATRHHLGHYNSDRYITWNVNDPLPDVLKPIGSIDNLIAVHLRWMPSGTSSLAGRDSGSHCGHVRIEQSFNKLKQNSSSKTKLALSFYNNRKMDAKQVIAYDPNCKHSIANFGRNSSWSIIADVARNPGDYPAGHNWLSSQNRDKNCVAFARTPGISNRKLIFVEDNKYNSFQSARIISRYFATERELTTDQPVEQDNLPVEAASVEEDEPEIDLNLAIDYEQEFPIEIEKKEDRDINSYF